MDGEVSLRGSVEEIIFHNRDNGYTVFALREEGAAPDSEDTVCVGYTSGLNRGETLLLSGVWKVHPTYGRQFSVAAFTQQAPTSAAAMARYLASGVVKGVGPKTAERIVDRFGESTFSIISEKPDRLVEIKGISYEKAMAIHHAFEEQHQLRQAMLYLQELGLPPASILRVYKQYKEKTIQVVKTDPYRLAEDVTGIGFLTADRMAAAAGISPRSPQRLKSGLLYVLSRETANGHVYLPKPLLLAEAEALLDAPAEELDNVLLDLQMENKVWQDRVGEEIAVYPAAFYHAEVFSAKKLLELAGTQQPVDGALLEKQLAQVTAELGIVLAEAQKDAVRAALTHGVMILTGGPGTGKTTTIRTMLRLLDLTGKTVALAAPTGRAAKRMTEATGEEAKTIHRLLEASFSEADGRQVFEKNEDDPLDADVVIIDETSMVDCMLLLNLLRAIPPGARLILVGDEDQLPSVGPGNVLKDMIASGCLPVIRLTEIFRQAEQSAIVRNAHRINQGQLPLYNERDSDFFFVQRAYPEDVSRTVVDLVTRRLPAFTRRDPFWEIQVLSPMRKGILGIQSLNPALQAALNPPADNKPQRAFRGGVLRLGDKVMQIKNNYDLSWEIRDSRGLLQESGTGVFNGDQGVVTELRGEDSVTVLFDGERRVKYDATQLEELELAYAITIHKSQGSEYPVIVIPVHSGPPMLLSRNLLYTGVTRAKELVALVGLPDTVKQMVENDREVRRYTGLARRLKAIFSFLTGEVGI